MKREMDNQFFKEYQIFLTREELAEILQALHNRMIDYMEAYKRKQVSRFDIVRQRDLINYLTDKLTPKSK